MNVTDETSVLSVSDRVLLCCFSGLHEYIVLQFLPKNLIPGEILKSETTCFLRLQLFGSNGKHSRCPEQRFMCISPQIQPDVCDVFGHSRVLTRILKHSSVRRFDARQGKRGSISCIIAGSFILWGNFVNSLRSKKYCLPHFIEY